MAQKQISKSAVPSVQPRRPIRASQSDAAHEIGVSLNAIQTQLDNSAPVQRLAQLQQMANAPLQRKNLEQAALTGNLVEKGQRMLVGSPLRGKEYGPEATLPASNRDDALKKASAFSAAIGNKVIRGFKDQEVGRGEGGEELHAPKYKWTYRGRDMNRAEFPKIDPFSLSLPFSFNENRNDVTLRFRFQHAAKFTGYVTEVHDSSKSEGNQTRTMYDENDPPEVLSDKYSNIHHDHWDTGILGAAKRGEGAGAFDAYTKIVGEGARWKCVRNHAANLQDDSYFVTLIDHIYWGVSFYELWNSWASQFEKKYDISNKTVKTKIEEGSIGGKIAAPHRLSKKDFDLDQSRPYERRIPGM